jgi:hypothetical protein
MSMLVRRPSPYDELFSLRQAVDRLSLRIPRAEQVKPHRITISPTSDARPLPAAAAAPDSAAQG